MSGRGADMPGGSVGQGYPGISAADDLREKLVTHYVGGRWRAPLATAGRVVRLACGVSPGQIVPAGQADIDRAMRCATGAVDRVAQEAIRRELADRLAGRSGDLEDALRWAQLAERGAAGCAAGDVALSRLGSGMGPVALLFPADLMPGAQVLLVETALRVGRPVLVKPAPGGAVAATVLFDALHRLALPAGVVGLLQGDGPATGALLRAQAGLDTVMIPSRQS